MNRRTAIQNAAALALAAAASPVGAQAGYAADAAAPPKPATVRDHLWIFTAPERANNELLEHNKKPVPLDLMKHQRELGLRWLKAGRVSDLILLGNTVLDLDFESAEFARQWIARVGPERLPHSGD